MQISGVCSTKFKYFSQINSDLLGLIEKYFLGRSSEGVPPISLAGKEISSMFSWGDNTS
jgi:hypothetical protein